MNVPQVVPIFFAPGFNNFVVRISMIVSIFQFTYTLGWGPPILSGVEISEIDAVIAFKRPLIIRWRRWVATPQAHETTMFQNNGYDN